MPFYGTFSITIFRVVFLISCDSLMEPLLIVRENPYFLLEITHIDLRYSSK